MNTIDRSSASSANSGLQYQENQGYQGVLLYHGSHGKKGTTEI